MWKRNFSSSALLTPEKYSSAAYRLGINYIVYSMTH
jgi:hypothetical protein